MNTSHLHPLDPADRALIETLIQKRFDMNAIIDRTSPHLAQHSHLNLSEWFGQPHIRAAIDDYQDAVHRAACCAHALDIAQQIHTLKAAFLTILVILQQTPPLPEDPLLAEKAARDLRSTVREARLLHSALKSLTRPPRIPRKHAAASSQLATPNNSPDDAQGDSSQSTTTISSATDTFAAPDSTRNPTTHNQAHARTNPPKPDLAASINTELRSLRTEIAAINPQFIHTSLPQPPDISHNQAEHPLLQTTS